jgi:hypothetical protein
MCTRSADSARSSDSLGRTASVRADGGLRLPAANWSGQAAAGPR